MNYLVLFNIVISVIYLYFGVTMMAKNPRASLNRVGSLIMLLFFIWSFCQLFTQNTVIDSEKTIIFLNKFAAIGWINFGLPALLVALIFTGRKKLAQNPIVIAAPAIVQIIIYVAYVKDLLMEHYVKTWYGWYGVWTGSVFVYLYVIYYFVMLSFCIWAYVSFLLRAPDPERKRQARIVFFAFITSFIGGLLLELIVPLVRQNPDFPHLGHILAVFWAAGVFYASFKYKTIILNPLSTWEYIVESISDMLILVNASRRIISVNRSAASRLRTDQAKVVGSDLDGFLSGGSAEKLAGYFAENDISLAAELVFIDSTRQEAVADTTVTRIFDYERNLSGYVFIGKDVTERKEAEKKQKLMEESVRQAEKMQSIGMLAGGIAHDFNNQLAGIIGFADLMLRNADNGQLVRKYSELIVKSGHHLAALTGQLLAFARKGKYQISTVDMHQVITEVVMVLERTISKKIAIRTELKAGISTVRGDPGQLSNAILNIGVNARDAMPDGGSLTIRTEIVEISKGQQDPFSAYVQPGVYLKTIISDTGMGIDASIQERIFEPFFTTKPLGKGTGMGLAAVYGTMKNHNGAITVSSKPGCGATFTFILPVEEAAAEKPVEIQEASLAEEPIETAKRIIVVDDEVAVREVICDILSEVGYAVVSFPEGGPAVEFFRSEWRKTAAVILDVMMPGMDGEETFQALRAINPSCKIMFCSGYAVQDNIKQHLGDGQTDFIQKPFDIDEFLRRIQKIVS